MRFLVIDDNPSDRELSIRELRKEFPDGPGIGCRGVTGVELALVHGITVHTALVANASARLIRSADPIAPSGAHRRGL